MLRIAQGVTGLNFLHANDGDNVTRLSSSQFGTLIGVHLNHTANTLCFTGEAVKDSVTLVEYAGVDTDKGQGAETVIHDLKR